MNRAKHVCTRSSCFDLFIMAPSIFCLHEAYPSPLTRGQRWRPVQHPQYNQHMSEWNAVCGFYMNVEEWRKERWRCGETGEGQDVGARRDMKRGLLGLGWGVQWLPGLQSGLRPLMSIHPFEAYWRVRGLDFYGDGFHLLESSLHLSPPYFTYCTSRSGFFPLIFSSRVSVCDLSHGFLKLSPLLASFPSPLPVLRPALNLTMSVFIRINMIPCDIFQMPICLS